MRTSVKGCFIIILLVCIIMKANEFYNAAKASYGVRSLETDTLKDPFKSNQNP